MHEAIRFPDRCTDTEDGISLRLLGSGPNNGSGGQKGALRRRPGLLPPPAPGTCQGLAAPALPAAPPGPTRGRPAPRRDRRVPCTRVAPSEKTCPPWQPSGGQTQAPWRARPHAAGVRRRLTPPARDSRGQKAGPRYLTGRVRVEHFAVDDEPELLPVPLALLTPAEVAADGGALSGGGHLAEGSKRGGQGSCGWTRFRKDLNDTETGLRGIRAALESGRSGGLAVPPAPQRPPDRAGFERQG